MKKKKTSGAGEWRGFGFLRGNLITASQTCVVRVDFFQDGYSN
jgi:hypothetical protein